MGFLILGGEETPRISGSRSGWWLTVVIRCWLVGDAAQIHVVGVKWTDRLLKRAGWGQKPVGE